MQWRNYLADCLQIWLLCSKRGHLRVELRHLLERSDLPDDVRETIRRHPEGRAIRKLVYVPAKIVNFVVG